MIALDTNILVRYLTQDDDVQFCAVLRLLSRKSATYWISDLALSETDWVLRDLYGWSSVEVAESLARLTAVHNLVFEDEARLRASLRAVREGADLADELLARGSRARGCRQFATFDKGVLRRHKPFAFAPA
jgi:predicted nucleic-acid-binding protein